MPVVALYAILASSSAFGRKQGRIVDLVDVHDAGCSATVYTSKAATVEPARSAARLRMVFLCSRHSYTTFMDRYFYDIYDAAKRSPHIEAHLFGMGWDGYSGELSLWENILKLFGPVDAIMLNAYGSDNNGHDSVPSNVTRFMRFQECHTLDMCQGALQDLNVDVGLMPFPNDMIQFHGEAQSRLLVHAPMAADRCSMFALVHQQRSRGLCVAGATSGVYPLRSRLYNLIQQGWFTDIPGGAHIREHPGYTHLENGTTLEMVEAQRTSYAKFFQDCKMVISTASMFRYSLQKYPEAMLAGALVIGDVPLDRPLEHRAAMVEISMEHTDEQIRSIVEKWLGDDEARMARAEVGQKWALDHLTWDSFASRLPAMYDAFHAGERGFKFPFPFDAGCQAMDRVNVAAGQGRQKRNCAPSVDPHAGRYTSKAASVEPARSAARLRNARG